IVNSGIEQLVIRGVGRVTSPEEISELPVKFAGGVTPLRVKDVAEVQIGHAFRIGAATDNGVESVTGVAMMLVGANSRAVSERVGGPHHSHRREESFRGRGAGRGDAVAFARQLARGAYRRHSHPTLVSL